METALRVMSFGRLVGLVVVEQGPQRILYLPSLFLGLELSLLFSGLLFVSTGLVLTAPLWPWP
jgi:hypothetical protein